MTSRREPWAGERPFKVIEEGWDEADFHARFAAIVAEMLSQRGSIINSYAQIEYLAADLIVKCRAFEEYQEHTRRLPFGLGQRVALLDEMCRFGPLAPHGGDIMPLLRHLMTMEETRHQLIHGFGSFHIQQDGRQCAMHFRRFVPLPGGKETRRELLILPEVMAIERDRWARFADTALGLMRRVYEALGLEAHDVTEGEPEVLR